MQKNKTISNWPLVGNSHIFEYLNKAINGYKAKNSQMSGAFIFSGEKDLGKTTAAYYFSRSLLCGSSDSFGYCGQCGSCRQFFAAENHQEKNDNENVHNDFFVVEKESDKKNISIEQIRGLIKSLSLTSFLGAFKVAIIKDAETMSDEAANALLKTLEEPNNKVIIILITTDLEHLPATVVSRSQILRFYPVKSDLIYDHLIDRHKAPRSAAKNFSRLCLGRPALAVKFFENKEFYQNYVMLASAIANMKKLNINSRFEKIEEWLKNFSGQELSGMAEKIIRSWQSIVRDMMLFHYNLDDLAQHEVINLEIKQARSKYHLADLIAIMKRLQDAEKLVRANVNPKAVLENLAISI